MKVLLVAAVLFALSVACSPPKATDKAQRDGKPKMRQGLVGKWTGKYKESKQAPNEGDRSNYFAEELGGFNLEFMPDGTFKSTMRGLEREGTWTQEKLIVQLKFTKVFGKTREETKAQASQDLPYFDEREEVLVSANGQILTLTSSSKDMPDVVFKPTD
ncbi:MAG: hypothetical protein JSS66_11745 [Armatimonadetes bacterium]|nr:hypothetical protein [Armatimonadota bacterium]